MNNILELHSVQKQYEAFSLKDVTFAVPQGYVMGFIGPNGAGKTTTIKAVLGMIHLTAGEIKVFGRGNGEGMADMKDKIGIVLDTPYYAEEWTVKDVEAAVAPFYSKWDHDKYGRLLREFNVDAGKKVKELSRGMKVKLMLAVALSHDAELLILDEPTSGLDPVARDDLLDILRTYMEDERKGVLFSTHITSDLEKIADYITFILDGRIIFSGLKDALLEKYVLVKGGPGDITAEQKRYLIGLREHSSGFEGLAQTADVGKFSSNVLCDPVSLEEIVVFMNKMNK